MLHLTSVVLQPGISAENQGATTSLDGKHPGPSEIFRLSGMLSDMQYSVCSIHRLTIVGCLVIFGDADFRAADSRILQILEGLLAKVQIMCAGVASHLEQPIVREVLHASMQV